MSIGLSPESIADFHSCVHRELLSYVSYPSSELAPRCFAYPQFLLEEDRLTLLEKSAFPDEGCLPMVMADTSASDMARRFGNIVVMVVNDGQPQDNRNYPDKEGARFNSIINPTFSKGKSAVEFTALSKHRLSSELMQVLDIQESVDLSSPLDHPVRLYPGEAAPQTNLVLVAQTTSEGARRCFGPFECTCSGEEVTLKASSSFNMLVAGFDEGSFAFSIELADENGDVTAQFVDAEELRRKLACAPDPIDWVSDAELRDALGRVARTGDDPLTKSQMRALKTNIATCSDIEAKMTLTPQRRQRMLSLLKVSEDWNSLPEEIKSAAVEKADPAQLAAYVLSNDHFRDFYDKVMENDQVRDRVEQDRARYQAQAEEARKAAREAAEDMAAARRELATYEEELEAKKAALEQEVAARTEDARRERDALAEEVGRLSSEKRALEEGKLFVERQIRQAVADMSDEAAVSGKLLENELIRQIVTAIAAKEDAAGAGEAAAANAHAAVLGATLRPDEGSLSAQEVLDVLERSIRERAGRDMDRNEVANLMICLTQGYILTLAGLPGTGKTSLASIMAGALGLANRADCRFVEVPVERGWTSYKDFIGYYNPLTKTMEQSNAAVFDAFSRLDGELAAQERPGALPPFLFLLDEANLSSIEHYWAPFLRACDSATGAAVDLSLGGSSLLRVPDHVRFVATVNFDHTTEELSPRFLDRSWVVTLDPEVFDADAEELFSPPCDFKDEPAFSFAKLQEAFGPRRDAAPSADLRAKLREVMDVCAKHGHSVSPRSQKMVWGYLRAADGLMDRSTAQSQYAPVDFAVAQKILPLLSGAEERLEGLLRDLGQVNGLPVVKGRVEHMLEVGNGSGYYQYFA